MDNVFQIWTGPQLPENLALMVEYTKETSSNYLMIDRKISEDIISGAPKEIRDKYYEMRIIGGGRSAFLRMYYLSLYPESIYIDCDAIFTKELKIDKVGIYCPFYERWIDDFILIGNNDKATIEKCVECYLKSKITKRGIFDSASKVVAHYNLIPEEYYKHLRYNAIQEANNGNFS